MREDMRNLVGKTPALDLSQRVSCLFRTFAIKVVGVLHVFLLVPDNQIAQTRTLLQSPPQRTHLLFFIRLLAPYSSMQCVDFPDQL